ncbi:MAG: hypothetical protein mread185_000158 [Mycoplasmataceae bacterium]|nr:MAG: hypothetical protein mread185_000158 [Mycoplasmataceae bacterium]
MSNSNEIIKALAEFDIKQQELKIGYLAIINSQIHHFLTKKDWEQAKEAWKIAFDVENW